MKNQRVLFVNTDIITDNGVNIFSMPWQIVIHLSNSRSASSILSFIKVMNYVREFLQWEVFC